MTTARVSRHLDNLVRERARHRCEYCQSFEGLTGQLCEIDHIVPRARGGPTEAENLCLACSACNGHKLARTHGTDPVTQELVLLFNPREQVWADHFAWTSDGIRILGLTAIGRATVELLKLNRPLAMSARAIWVSMGLHPPSD